ncbi:MAG TPA: leucyl aminopeptidase [Vicinamibacterales bacterium]|nr:leucyl aminopeptidase [Vicinamibacterales bacterium]
MNWTPAAPAFSFSVSKPSEIETDLLIVPVFEADSLDDIGDLTAAADGHLQRAFASGEIKGRPFEWLMTPLSGWKAPRVALIGAGKRTDLSTERLRRLGTAAALQARQRQIARIAWVHRGDPAGAAAVQAVTEGIGLASFSGDVYKSGERGNAPVSEAIVVITGGEASAIEPALHRGRILAESCNLSRAWCNAPPNELTPTVFAERAAEIGRTTGLDVEILDEKAIAALNMGLLLGVARGSVEPPRVIVLKHMPGGITTGPVLGLVGKGLTFDTGGISIKPADGMERMKTDMTGGAAVVCAMRAIAMLKAPIRVIGVVPAAENMPGGRAIKPADILTGASGTTVEVINTDAEGRLILGDGLWYARQLGATHLVDVATLTGACVVALGKVASGLFGQPTSWMDVVRGASERAGDRLWPMPLYDEYAEQLKSEIADMINSGGRPAGACTAAAFLKAFVGDLPWAHLDIAGTAWADESKPWQPKGTTGVAVRTLAELALSAETWR